MSYRKPKNMGDANSYISFENYNEKNADNSQISDEEFERILNDFKESATKNNEYCKANQQKCEYEDFDDDRGFSAEDFLIYDDMSDDVRRYRKRERVHYEDRYYNGHDRKPSTARRVIGKIMLYLQAALSILLMVLLINLNILSGKYLAIFAGVLAILWLAIFFTQRKRRNIAQAIGMIISMALSVAMAVGSAYLIKTNQVLDTVSSRSYDIRTYDVVVLNSNSAQNIVDAADYTFAIDSTISEGNRSSVVSDIQKDTGKAVEIIEMSSATELASALLNGEVQAVIYNDAFTSTIVEQYSDYESQVRIIGNYTIKTESNIENIDVDVLGGAFLVFISGTDSEGTVSLTGRSDVDIVVGVNTVTNQILMITIPRDYYVEIPGVTSEGTRDKLTHAGIYGMDELLSTVENLLGRNVNYYVRLNFSSLIEIVDAMGGVTIENEQEFISHGGYYYPAGTINLDGEYTLHYVRERYAFEDGDFARGRHQIQVIQAMMDKLISANTLANYNALADAISNFAVTNMQSDDIKSLIRYQFNNTPEWHIVSYQLLGDVMYQPCQSANYQMLSVDMPYVEAIENAQKLLNQLFDGEVLSEDLQLTDNGQLTYVASPVG